MKVLRSVTRVWALWASLGTFTEASGISSKESIENQHDQRQNYKHNSGGVTPVYDNENVGELFNENRLFERNLQGQCVLETQLYGSFNGSFRNVEFLYQMVVASGTSQSQITTEMLPKLERNIVEGVLPAFFNCPGTEPIGLVNGMSPSGPDTLNVDVECLSEVEGDCYTVLGTMFVFGTLVNDAEAAGIVVPKIQKYIQGKSDWTNVDARLLDVIYVMSEDGTVALPPDVLDTPTTSPSKSAPPTKPLGRNRLSLLEIVAQTFVLKSFEKFAGISNVTAEISGQGPYTVFMPWNYALDRLPEDWVTRFQSSAWLVHLREILLYHVFDGDLSLSEVEETHTITMVNGENVVVSRQRGTSRIHVNDILVLATYDARNGFAYMLDDVLLPKWWRLSLLKVAQSMPDTLSTLAALVARAEMESMLSDNDGLSLLAPNDGAFAIFFQSVTSEISKDELQEILRNHIIPGPPIPLPSFLESKSTSILTLGNGKSLELLPGNPVIVKGTRNEARFVAYDQLANNGIIHTIDAVLLPDLSA